MLFKNLKIMLLCVIAAFTSLAISAQEVERADASGLKVQIKIFFPYDQAYIDSDYMGNRHNMQQIDSLLRDSAYVATLGCIEVTAQSSPEGSVQYNARLSERRRLSIQKYFTTTYPEINHDLWSFKAVAENWELFHQNLEADVNLPERERVLEISNSNRGLDQKEWLLKTMDGGEPWNYIKENILPSQRFGAGVVFIPLAAMPIAARFDNHFDSALTIPSNTNSTLAPIALPTEPARGLFAVKTNMLYDLGSALNVELEVPIGERFSITGEWINPWWYSARTNYTMRVHMGTVGAKYWLGDRSDKQQLRGWAVGANVGFGSKYDFQIFKETGVQGSYFMAGATLGYAHQLYKNFNLEYQLGVGGTWSEYKNYTMAYNTEHGDIKVFDYPWITKRKTIIGVTQLRVSLAYMIFYNKKVKR